LHESFSDSLKVIFDLIEAFSSFGRKGRKRRLEETKIRREHELVEFPADCSFQLAPLLLQFGIAVLCACAKLFLDADELVVFSHTVCAAH